MTITIKVCGARCDHDDHDPGDEWICTLPPGHDKAYGYHAALVVGGWHEWYADSHETLTNGSTIDLSAPAYNGDTEPQRGPLSPLQRDIVCRLIRDHLAERRQRERDHIAAATADVSAAELPSFLRGLRYALDNDAEVPLLLDARAKLSPRTDDAQAAQLAVEHDYRAGLG
jgi:hypothetical protein